MTVLQFGSGWRDSHGRPRTLMWFSDVGWLLWDNGYDVDVFRRCVYDEISLRACLLGWEDHVDDPRGPEWVVNRVATWQPHYPSPHCIICQGEGWVAGPDGYAVECGCGEHR